MTSVTLKSLTEKQRQFLETLQLSDKFPEKISLSDVMTLRDESEEAAAQSISDVPMLMLKSVVMNNYQLFGSLLSNLASSAAPTNEDEDDDWSEDSNTECTHSMALLQHQDVFLACYLCCDAPLKQVLAEKLFDCKLAVPLSWFGGYVSQLFTLPLRTGELKYRGQDKVSKQKCINSDSFSVLSVIRLGNNAVSKSQLINRCVHDKQMVFRESSTSLGERIFSDGSIEQTWMLPSLNDADLKLNEPVCVLNLRGDAVKCQQQMRFLADVSTCIIVSLSDDADKQGEIGDFLKKVFHHNQDIILVISSTKVPDFLRQLRSHFGDTFKEKVRIVKEADRKTSSELLTDVKKRLHIKMIESKKSMTLTNLGEIAENSYNMLVDERQPAVQQVISNAKELVDTAVRFDATDRKKTLLPLHGQPWHEISKLQKDRVRDAQKLTGNERVKQEENDNLKIKELRRQQIEFLKKGNSRDFILRFIKLFKEASDNGQISIFLRSLKLFLDGENTRIQKSNSVAPADLQASVLGVEHIFRELSQLYEATLNNERVAEQLWIPTGLSCHTELLDLAVQLIVQGHPFELIDGDASAITIKWIEGVLKKLQEKFKKESLLIVSVLGIQSSGKSTLLNTMFGLQLPVSAGRCTRGAFLQMVRNDRTKSGLNADFIMIIDTEGLRSTELGNDGKHRDNELATMAVGLADVTIINIMGENIHEMTNVLQIVVYAFLRISNASPNLIKGKACLFVHQNVCAVDSREKMQEARDRLLRTLDSTVEGAANEEGVTNLKRFADLLKFDVNENVIFLTNLWEGEPPLAPVNPGYSRGVQGTKYKIVQCLKGMYSSKLTFKEFYVRAADFWKAVVKEDFVFSFQNTLELSAYKEVNKKYSELRRDLEKKAWEQVKETAAPNLRSCQDAQSLRERLKTEIAETNKFIKENQSEKQKEIESFFKKHEESQTIVQWQQRTFNNFEEDVKSLTRECNERLTEVKEERRVLLQSRGEADQLKQEFMDKARQVAEKMVAENRSQITDDELRKEFDTMWEKQMKEVPMKPMQTINFFELAEKALLSEFESRRSNIQNEINKLMTVTQTCVPLRVDLIGNDQYDAKWHMAVKFWPSEEKCKTQVFNFSNSVLKKVEKEIIQLQRDNGMDIIDRGVFSSIIHFVDKEIDEFNSDQSKEHLVSTRGYRWVTLKPQLKDFFSVYACFYAAAEFKTAHEQFEQQFGVRAQLQAFKNTVFEEFRNCCKREGQDVRSASVIAGIIRNFVSETALRQAANFVSKDFLDKKNESNEDLVKQVTKSLIDTNEFDDWIEFIKDSKAFTRKWLVQTMEEQFFKPDPEGNSKYTKVLNERVHNLLEPLKNRASEMANQQMSGHDSCTNLLQFWIERFCEQGDMIGLHVEDFKVASQYSISDLQKFNKRLLKYLKNVTDFIHNPPTSPEQLRWDGKAPHVSLLDKDWNDLQDCPLCGEPTSTRQVWTSGYLLWFWYKYDKNARRCRSVRPAGVAGITDPKSGNLSVATCGELNTFTFRQESHKMEDLSECFPHWYPPCSPPGDESSLLWRWFVRNHKESLSKHYGKRVEVPESWEKIKKTEDGFKEESSGGCLIM